MAATTYQHVTADERGRGGISRNQNGILSSDAVTAAGREEHGGWGCPLTTPPLHQNAVWLNKLEEGGPPHFQETHNRDNAPHLLNSLLLSLLQTHTSSHWETHTLFLS
ncbi:hypothetical protein ATANTOWER_013021 [Ataeniobius toweri]|uniref:Uncharacterized protein n=1 Tax=Ataeniobius toweri TaxID=208326 RepID=A0ABU7AY37_9TELE|nr:hypothetical protein [Ataeniobius toweri]